MATTKNYSGEQWNSQTLAQSFIKLSDIETIEYGLKDTMYRGLITDKSRIFKGKRAIRIQDELNALIDLTKKPEGYPYDFVIL